MEMSCTYIKTGREGGKGLLGLITHMCKSNWKSSVFMFTDSGNFSRSIPGITPWEVINPDPLTVYLIYNCYYMREICKNAENFAATTRGQDLHPASGLGNNIYGYDLDTGDGLTGNPNSRQQSRRSASCPDSWIGTHTCPEPDQRKPMRHDGEWFTTLLEPGTTTNNLMNVRDPITNNVLVYSNIRYTCDEFPPATWYVLYCVLIFTTNIANSMLNLCFPPPPGLRVEMASSPRGPRPIPDVPHLPARPISRWAKSKQSKTVGFHSLPFFSAASGLGGVQLRLNGTLK